MVEHSLKCLTWQPWIQENAKLLSLYVSIIMKVFEIAYKCSDLLQDIGINRCYHFHFVLIRLGRTL